MYASVDETRGSDRRFLMERTIWLTFVCALVTVVLLSLLVARPADLEVTRTVVHDNTTTVTVACSNALVSDSVVCDQTSDCMQGYVGPSGDACTYLPRPSTTVNCSSACYAPGSTHCDGNGGCVGEPSGCVGSCTLDNECETLFAFNEALQNTYDPVSFWTWGSWYAPYGCLLGRCTALVLDIFAGSSANALFTNNVTYAWTPLGALTECKEYLLPEFRAAYGDCLTTERYLLDPSVIRSYNLFGGATYGNASYPFQLSVCLFSFTCAPLVAPVSIATTTQNSAQTQEQWGFYAASGTVDEPTGPALNVQSPQLRSVAWSEVRETIAAIPYGYFERYLAQPNLDAQKK